MMAGTERLTVEKLQALRRAVFMLMQGPQCFILTESAWAETGLDWPREVRVQAGVFVIPDDWKPEGERYEVLAFPNPRYNEAPTKKYARGHD